MAAISLSPLPHDLSSMSTSGRRVPLSNNSNAVNSPYRGAASKQKRSYATIQREDAYGQQPPPAKKQMLDSHQSLKTPPRQQLTQSSVESKLFTRRSQNSTQSSFERRTVTVRERPQQVITKAERTVEGSLERLRWQKHHRKLFPSFVFYFESVPEDIRIKYTKQVNSLGAREEKFFSKAVTHVVTTRNIPAEQHTSTDASFNSATNDSQSQNSQPQTINPLLLDRSSESANCNSDLTARTKFTFEAPIGKRTTTISNDLEAKRNPGRSADVLYRARELGIKIWALEKLQRMMEAMFDVDPNTQALHGHNTRSNSVQGTLSNRGRAADLSQLLRDERINGPSDRDPTVATKEMNLFKGPFIYIHDIDERQKPIMVREYPKVAHKEDGDWPQFRSVSGGKCPFVEEFDNSKAEKEKELLRLQKQQEKEKALATRSRAGSVEPNKMQPPKSLTGKRILTEMDDGSNRNATVSTKQANPFLQSKTILPRMEREPSSQRSQNAFVSRAGAGAGRLFAGEPVASGVQPSNVTSAIRSTMISSTAAQPGLKAGTSKEVHGLQRKVLEKNSGGPGSYGLASSHRMTDITAAAREESTAARTNKRREKLAQIEEDVDPSEAEETARKIEAARKAKAVQQRKHDKRDPKPGYCENCQDKFEDFDEHILSRKHRRFAEKLENWKELDALLDQLRRPRREYEDEDDY